MTIDTRTTTGGASELTANPMDQERNPLPKLLTSAPLCQARTRRGTSCRSPAEKGKGRCRFHGSRAGAPKGEANGSYRHGGKTYEAVELRREASRLLTAIRSEAYA